MPVCIAGMHRSGTSMVARLLNLCGVYIGSADDFAPSQTDNPEGYWENLRFVRLNDQILEALGGAWDVPPLFPPGWELQPAMTLLRAQAALLLQTMPDQTIWGWKDPRNSLTLPFWYCLIPRLQVIHCIRNPLEIVRSLQKRGYSSANFGLKLWLTYNRTLMDAASRAECVITHYDTFFFDPEGELRRIVNLLNIPASSLDINRACAAAVPGLRHQRSTTQELLEAQVPAQVVDLYLQLCAQAGPVYQLAAAREPAVESKTLSSLNPTRQEYLGAFRASQVQILASQLATNEKAVQALTIQLQEKEQTIKRLSAQSTEKEKKTEAQVGSKGQELRSLQQTAAEQMDHLDALNVRMQFLTSRETELRTLLLDAHEQLKERDEELRSLQAQMRERFAQREAEVHEQLGAAGEQLRQHDRQLRAELNNLHEQIQQSGKDDLQTKHLHEQIIQSLHEEVEWLEGRIHKMESTRMWRLGGIYWRFHTWLVSIIRI